MFGDFERAIKILEQVKELAPEEEKLGVQQAIIELQNALFDELRAYEEAMSASMVQASYEWNGGDYESY